MSHFWWPDLLELEGVVLVGSVTVHSGGTLHLMNAIVLQSQVSAESGATVTRESTASGLAAEAANQCAQSYTTLNDAYRATSHATTVRHCDSATGESPPGTGVGGGRWYRFSGAGGDALPLSPPGSLHCGTDATGWLSGWDGGVGTGCSEEPQAYGRTTGALLEDGGASVVDERTEVIGGPMGEKFQDDCTNPGITMQTARCSKAAARAQGQPEPRR